MDTSNIHRLVCGLIARARCCSAPAPCTEAGDAPSLTGPSELGTVDQRSPCRLTSCRRTARRSRSSRSPRATRTASRCATSPLRAEITVDGVDHRLRLRCRPATRHRRQRPGDRHLHRPGRRRPIVVDTGTIVQIIVVPTGTDFANETTRFATIRLVPPGVIGAPPSPFRPEFTAPGPAAGDLGGLLGDRHRLDRRRRDERRWPTSRGTSATAAHGHGPQRQPHLSTTPGTFAVSLTITDTLGRNADVTQLGDGRRRARTRRRRCDCRRRRRHRPDGQLQRLGVRAPAGPLDHDYLLGLRRRRVGRRRASDPRVRDAGTYTVTLTVTDDAGQTARRRRRITVANGDPTADVHVQPVGAARRPPVTSTRSCVDGRRRGRTDRVLHAGPFGDGSPARDQTRSAHRSQLVSVRRRTYNVLLTVTRQRREDEQRHKTITVTRDASGKVVEWRKILG